ncbi:MAG TPA: hypothetical protein VGO93_16045 [Candidatus Xenobia bacterium]|jgi:hypothetical protein
MAAISSGTPVKETQRTGAVAPPPAPPQAPAASTTAADGVPKDKTVQGADDLKKTATGATTKDEKTYTAWAAASQIARNNLTECADYMSTGKVKSIPPQQASKELMTLFNHFTSPDTAGQLPITFAGRNMQGLTEQNDETAPVAREHVSDYGYDSAARAWAGHIQDLAAEKQKQGMPQDAAIASAVLDYAQVKSADDLTLKETCPELFMAAEKFNVAHTDPAGFLDESKQLEGVARTNNPQLAPWYDQAKHICTNLRAQGDQMQMLDPQTAYNNFTTLAAYWTHDAFSLFPPVSGAGAELQVKASQGDKGAISQASFGGWDAPQRLAMRKWFNQMQEVKQDGQNPLSQLPKDQILAKIILDDPDEEGQHFEIKKSALQYLTSVAVSGSQAMQGNPNAAGNVAGAPAGTGNGPVFL